MPPLVPHLASFTSFSFSDDGCERFIRTNTKQQHSTSKLNPNLSDLNRQVRCLAAAEVDGVGALMVPEPDPGAGPEAAAQAPWNCISIN